MKKLKQFLGILWMLIGPVAIFFLVHSAIKNVGSGKTGDITNPIPWIIIIAIFLPIAIGFCIFGWYALKGEYDSAVFTHSSDEAE